MREDGSLEELTFIEAVKVFEARMEERSLPLHEKHHNQVSLALSIFTDMEEQSKILHRKVNTAQGPNEKKAIAYLDGFMSISNISEYEEDMIVKAKRAISSGKFQQLQRDINKLKTSTKKTPLRPVILLEKLMEILTQYPLEHVTFNEREVIVPVKKKDCPEIIISESFIC